MTYHPTEAVTGALIHEFEDGTVTVMPLDPHSAARAGAIKHEGTLEIAF